MGADVAEEIVPAGDECSAHPKTQLPVLLMELCDESLTAFLERSTGPLSYHIQVNIAHDVALALVSNGLIPTET